MTPIVTADGSPPSIESTKRAMNFAATLRAVEPKLAEIALAFVDQAPAVVLYVDEPVPLESTMVGADIAAQRAGYQRCIVLPASEAQAVPLRMALAEIRESRRQSPPEKPL